MVFEVSSCVLGCMLDFSYIISLIRWVHIVCALYTPGVAFGDVDKLSLVTLFEMPYSKWGARVSVEQENILK